MAQKRMLDKKISVSEQVSNLDLLGQLLFTWMIPHADDLGLLPYSPKTIKAMIIPMLNITLEDVIAQIKAIKNQKLIVTFEYKDEKFLRIVNFLNSQTLKKDRNPSTMLKIELPKEAPQSWEICEKLLLEDSGFQMEDSGFQMDTEVNIIKDNIREFNLREVSNVPVPLKKQYSLLEEVAEEDMQQIAQHYQVPLAFVKSKYEDMCLWAGEKTGRDKGRNWKLTLQNWVKRDRVKIMERSLGDPTKRSTDAREL